MSHSKRFPLAERLTRMNLIVSGAVLLIATLVFFTYDLLSFRQDLIRNVEAEARIVADNSVTALTFDDPQSASRTLGSLRRSPDISYAELRSADGEVFAQYRNQEPSSQLASGNSYQLASGESDHVWSSGNNVYITHRIGLAGKTIGTVSIAARLREIRHRAAQYIVIAIVIFLFGMGAAVAISSAAQRWAARPIKQLAETALRVSQERDYSIRAQVHTDVSEIAILIEQFNAMLSQIGERDTALTAARDQLEIRVRERTAQLEAANRELEAFSYTVAHDLRGPLDSIGNIAYLLKDACTSSNDSIAPMLEQLRGSIASMNSLIEDLLNLSRVSSEPLHYDLVDLSPIARQIASELSAADPARKVEFAIASVPAARSDPGLMRVVLDNLLRNAWKYSSHHAHAHIEFGVQSSPAGAPSVYFVRDDGAGFDSSRANELFLPFHRLHDRAEFPGSGIGLATVHRILQRQGGSIWAEAAVEKGATFYFTLSG